MNRCKKNDTRNKAKRLSATTIDIDKLEEQLI